MTKQEAKQLTDNATKNTPKDKFIEGLRVLGYDGVTIDRYVEVIYNPQPRE